MHTSLWQVYGIGCGSAYVITHTLTICLMRLSQEKDSLAFYKTEALYATSMLYALFTEPGSS